MAVRVSQLPVEAVVKPETQKVRLSQQAVEVVYSTRVVGSARMSQLAVEVIYSAPVTPPTRKFGYFVQCI